MARESDRNRKMFHKGHYEVIAARFREQASTYATLPVEVDDTTKIMNDLAADHALNTLRDLADALAERFEFDDERFKRPIFLERCGFIV